MTRAINCDLSATKTDHEASMAAAVEAEASRGKAALDEYASKQQALTNELLEEQVCDAPLVFGCCE